LAAKTGKMPDIAAQLPDIAGQNAQVVNEFYLLFTRTSEG
jgi:hypothetical protein